MTDEVRAVVDELRAKVASLAADVARLTGLGLQQYEVVTLRGRHDALYVPRPCGWCIGWVMIGGQYGEVELLYWLTGTCERRRRYARRVTRR